MTTTNQRRELRIQGLFTVLIETHSSAPGDDIGPRVVICNTMDVSANGLMLHLDDQLPEEAIFQLYIEFGEERRRRYHLVGEVRWARLSEDGEGYLTGFSLYESDGSDIDAWKALIAEMLEDSRHALRT
jgi:hypothetical protein